MKEATIKEMREGLDLADSRRDKSENAILIELINGIEMRVYKLNSNSIVETENVAVSLLFGAVLFCEAVGGGTS